MIIMTISAKAYTIKRKKKFDEIRKILSRLIRRYEDIRIRKLKKERKKIKKETRSEIKKNKKINVIDDYDTLITNKERRRRSQRQLDQ